MDLVTTDTAVGLSQLLHPLVHLHIVVPAPHLMVGIPQHSLVLLSSPHCLPPAFPQAPCQAEREESGIVMASTVNKIVNVYGVPRLLTFSFFN